MTYFKLNGTDFSNCVNSLKVTKQENYTSAMNAAGNTVVDRINTKRQLEVGIIPLTDQQQKSLQSAIAFESTVYYRDPKTGTLSSFKGIIPQNAVEYYTIQSRKVSFKAYTITITEL